MEEGYGQNTWGLALDLFCPRTASKNVNRSFWRLTSRASRIHRRLSKCEESFGGETIMQSLPEEKLDFLGARGSQYLVPTGFIPRGQLTLEKKFCCELDRACALIVGAEKGIIESSNSGHQNTLNRFLDLGGRGRLMDSKLQVWLAHSELTRRSSSWGGRGPLI